MDEPVEECMKQDGRTPDHKRLEVIRRMAVQRVREGEKPSAVIASLASTGLHFLPGYAPDLNPDELVWSHVKRPELREIRSKRASNCKIASTPSCSRCSETTRSCVHSATSRPSPIFPTAE